MFRVPGACAAVLLVTTLTTHAGTMLYVTGTTPKGDGRSRIYGYCLGPGGGFLNDGLPRIEQPTSGQYPRRFTVWKDETGVARVLFAAEIDRIEAYRIGPKGGLTKLNQTDPLPRMNPHDVLAVGNTLYVPRRGQSQIVTYAIGPDGFERPDTFDSCVHQRTQGNDQSGPAAWESMAVSGDNLYVTLSNFGDGIRVYKLLADGKLEGRLVPGEPDTSCPANQDGRSPRSDRLRLGGPRTLVVQDGRLYVQSQGKKRVNVFNLNADGLFEPRTAKAAADADVKQQAPASRTRRTRIYDDLVLHRSALLGSVFPRGRIDSYLLGADGVPGSLPKRPARITSEDTRATPLRIRAHEDTLYAPGGDLDRVRAYRLRDDGTLAAAEPFSQTVEITGSFPNEVVVVTTADDCN